MYYFFLYMDGPAFGWFQWMHRNGHSLLGMNYYILLEIRFALSQYDDPQGSLFKLSQQSSIADYQTKFETLSN